LILEKQLPTAEAAQILGISNDCQENGNSLENTMNLDFLPENFECTVCGRKLKSPTNFKRVSKINCNDFNNQKGLFRIIFFCLCST